MDRPFQHHMGDLHSLLMIKCNSLQEVRQCKTSKQPLASYVDSVHGAENIAELWASKFKDLFISSYSHAPDCLVEKL